MCPFNYKCIRKILEFDPSAKIVAASGYSKNAQVKETLEAGASGYIGKPYQIRDHLNTIRDVLDETE